MGVYVVNTDATDRAAHDQDQELDRQQHDQQRPGTNLSGNGSPGGYQAGIVDYGKGDNIVNNKISGTGYDTANAPTELVLRPVRHRRSTKAHFNNNG